MPSPYHHYIRDATLVQDEAFIISVFDASLPYLESIGSQAQWGSTPFSQRPGWIDETQSQIREAEQNVKFNTTDALRVLILEVEVAKQELTALDNKDAYSRTVDDRHCLVSVGFAFVRGNWLPNYLPADAVAQARHVRFDESLYVEIMVSDSRLREQFPGIGAALLHEIGNWSRSRGKAVLYLDSWAGNDRNLIRFVPPHLIIYGQTVLTTGHLLRYYEKQGFQILIDFSLPRKDKDLWHGTLMHLKM